MPLFNFILAIDAGNDAAAAAFGLPASQQVKSTCWQVRYLLYFITILSSCKAADFLLGRLTPMMVFSPSQAVKSFT